MAVLSKATWIGIAAVVVLPIAGAMWVCWLAAKAEQDRPT